MTDTYQSLYPNKTEKVEWLIKNVSAYQDIPPELFDRSETGGIVIGVSLKDEDKVAWILRFGQ